MVSTLLAKNRTATVPYPAPPSPNTSHARMYQGTAWRYERLADKLVEKRSITVYRKTAPFSNCDRRRKQPPPMTAEKSDLFAAFHDAESYAA